MGTPEQQAFAEWSPCVYMGKILCAECPKDGLTHPELKRRDEDCDMRHGRITRQRAFEAGFAAALESKAIIPQEGT